MGMRDFETVMTKLDHMFPEINWATSVDRFRQIDHNTFTFRFDGFLWGAVRFYKDGSIGDWQDVDPDDKDQMKHPINTYRGINVWMSTLASQLDPVQY